MKCVPASPRLLHPFRPTFLQFAGVTVDRSFDVWSLGMAVLHMHIGKSYFQDSGDPQVGGGTPSHTMCV